MKASPLHLLLLLNLAQPALAAEPSEPAAPPKQGGHAGHARSGSEKPSAANRPVGRLSPDGHLPPPVSDDEDLTYLLLDRLEYGRYGLHWDAVGWHGGDVNRWWFKSEGDQSTRGFGGEADLQLLRGRLISPFLDLQYGFRYEQKWGRSNPGRAFAAVGLQGLVPYRFDVEPTLFVSQEGDLSARFTATYDLLLTQRLILQPRLETNLALQQVDRFGVGSGLNDLELALLLRYEIRREFAPYVGLSWKRSFGGSADFLRREGEDVTRLQFVAGLRAWF